ncbi:MAG: tripartite tricarboxylate transporter TctB family protein [Sphaerochaeta sp.]|nr:tripartite tricarboxylate transporter TctB family protein [Sphaerochaeta sp.]
MNKATKKELGVGIFFAVLAIAYILESLNVSTFTPFGNRGLDSQSVPAMIGWLSFGLSVLYIIITLVKDRKNRRMEATENDQVCDVDNVVCMDIPQNAKKLSLTRIIPIKLLLSLVYLFLYFLFYQSLGFILSSIGYLIAESVLLTEKTKRKKWALFITLFSVGIVVLIYVVFTNYLTLFLPKGILG